MIGDITTENHNLRLMLLQEMHDRINIGLEIQAAQKDTNIKNEEQADEGVVEEVRQIDEMLEEVSNDEYDAEEECEEIR